MAKPTLNVDSSPPQRPCLLPLLQPVRHCLQPHLDDRSAAVLLQTSHATASSLLCGYSFVDHVFACHSQSVQAARRSFALFARYHMRILRLSFSRDWNESLVDSETGQSILPLSLLALTLGQDFGYSTVANASFGVLNETGQSLKEDVREARDEDGEIEFSRRIQSVSLDRHNDTAWNVHAYGESSGAFNQRIPPSALPPGLRFLQFSSDYNHTLQQGSIPDSVQVLQFGRDFNQPLSAGHLPSSLTHLVFGDKYNTRLPPGVLPAGLLRLRLGVSYTPILEPGTLPSQLQQLAISDHHYHPLRSGVVPSSVTHLRLGWFCHSPLQGSLPHGLVHLNLGDWFSQQLLPGLLPTSLRELIIGESHNQPLLPGSLPDGLEVLAFHPRAEFSHTIEPGVIPASVVVVSMGKRYKQDIVAGGIPATVRWLRLPPRYQEVDLTDVCSRATRVLYWRDTRD